MILSYGELTIIEIGKNPGFLFFIEKEKKCRQTWLLVMGMRCMDGRRLEKVSIIFRC